MSAPTLPPEVLEHILTLTNDWELASTLGIRTDLPFNHVWYSATTLDWAILSADLTQVKRVVAEQGPTSLGLSQWGSRVMIRFGYVDMLDFLFHHDKTASQLKSVAGPLIAAVASSWGRVSVLEWARRNLYTPDNFRDLITEEAMDDASRHGQTAVLDWWRASTALHPLKYSENALASASVKAQVESLDWWKASGLPLKMGPVLDFASMARSTLALDWWVRQADLEPRYTKAALYFLSSTGNTRLLSWWREQTRFPLRCDKDVLMTATKHGQVAALQWWADSGLRIEYRLFDVEEALEDSIDGKEEARRWWLGHGYQPEMGVVESVLRWFSPDVGLTWALWCRWMKTRRLC
jgi:hypothetical protein